MGTPRRASSTAAPAVTLVESLLAATVLAMAAVAMTLPFAAGAQQTAEAGKTARAVALAEALMEEILAHPYCDPDDESQLGPEPSERSRPAWDNVDDYHGLAEPPGGMCRADGRLIDDPAFAGFGRAVSISSGDVVLPAAPRGDPPPMLRVTVTVTWGGETRCQLGRWVSPRN